MDEKDVFLKIEIKYEKDFCEFETEEEIKYDDLVKKVIEKFDINEDKKDYLEFKYLDEDEDINILRKENDDIFNAAHEDEDGNYSLKLNLNISEYKNTKNNLNEKKSNNKINNKEIIEIENKEENYKKKIRIIDEIYRKQILNMKKVFNNIIEEKIKNIEQDILQYGIDIDRKKHTNLINNNKQKNSKNNIKNNNKNFIDDIDDQDSSSNSSNDNLIITTHKNKKNKLKKNEINIIEEDYNDYANIDFEEVKENIQKSNNNNNIIFSKNYLSFGNVNMKYDKDFNKDEKDYKKIKNALYALYKKTKEYEQEIIKNGNTIKDSLDKKKISTKNMNSFYIQYINQKEKDDKFEFKDSIFYFISLRRINLYLEKCRFYKKLDKFFIFEEMVNNKDNLDLNNINENEIENEKEYQNKLNSYLNGLIK